MAGLNFKNEAHAIASWTKPSCQTNAANTARNVSAIAGESARLGQIAGVLCIFEESIDDLMEVADPITVSEN